MSTATIHNCVSCGNPFAGVYCNNCGEKILKQEERTLWHFIQQLFHNITSIDTQLLRSLRALFLKPGSLSKAFVDGKRKLYTAPLSLFFIANVLYFFVLPVDALNTSFNSQVTKQKYSGVTYRMAEKKMQAENLDYSRLEEKYNAASSNIANSLIILVAVLFSLPVSLLFYHKKQYYFNHLTFSLHFITFLIFGVLIILPFLLALVMIMLRPLGVEMEDSMDSGIIFTLILGVLFTYLFIAARRFYQQKYIYLVPKTLLLLAGMFAAVIAYRFILFVIVLYTI